MGSSSTQTVRIQRITPLTSLSSSRWLAKALKLGRFSSSLLLIKAVKGIIRFIATFERSLGLKGSMWGYKRFYRRTLLETSDFFKADCLIINCKVGVVVSEALLQFMYKDSLPEDVEPVTSQSVWAQLSDGGGGGDTSSRHVRQRTT